MIHGPLRDTVLAWSLADIETSDDFMNRVRGFNLDSLKGVRTYDLSAKAKVSITAGTEGSVTG
jgi:hypothetical protein